MKLLLLRMKWKISILLAFGALIFGLLAVITGQQAEILVEWSTASELDIVGYNLYRSDSVGAAFEKINPALIPASIDPQTGGDYNFLDPNVFPNKVYYYELEAVSDNGQNERHGPIIAEAQSSFPAAWPMAIILGICALLSGAFYLASRRSHV